MAHPSSSSGLNPKPINSRKWFHREQCLLQVQKQRVVRELQKILNAAVEVHRTSERCLKRYDRSFVEATVSIAG